MERTLQLQKTALDPLWVQAMNSELKALQENHTWDIVPFSFGKKTIGCQWVYKVNFKSNGSLERYKARLVAIGYNQEYGIDFLKTFSPVIWMIALRCIIALASSRHWFIHQLDINNAFLHGDLHENVYMQIPDGLSKPSNMVCKLRKSL